MTDIHSPENIARSRERAAAIRAQVEAGNLGSEWLTTAEGVETYADEREAQAAARQSINDKKEYNSMNENHNAPLANHMAAKAKDDLFKAKATRVRAAMERARKAGCTLGADPVSDDSSPVDGPFLLSGPHSRPDVQNRFGLTIEQVEHELDEIESARRQEAL